MSDAAALVDEIANELDLWPGVSIERRADGAALLRYGELELGVLYRDRGLAELPFLGSEHENWRSGLPWPRSADDEIENPAVSVATAVMLYLASKGGHASYDRDRYELMRLAARAQWNGHPPTYVADWLAERGVEV